MAWTVWIAFGALFAGLGVGLGAFAAHALRDTMLNEHLHVFETAVRYQMYHALALLFIGALALRVDSVFIAISGMLMVLGILAFSGSLYAIILLGQRQLGMVTPVGGVLLILGWISLLTATISVWWRS